ncbi:MAG: hypothetical protein DMG62_00735 [Acidobacteria bacterium]|nr:MAG: hypothetical protein DMG62_00735 [Acidobacteriota bacterium]
MKIMDRNDVGMKLTRARTQLLLDQPFFGTLCLRLKLMPGSVRTMATDGSRILYDANFVAKLTAAELQAVLAHEVLHCALGHHCRRGQRDPQVWNEAADLAINPILVGNGFTLPADALNDPTFVNLCAEEIYARLMERGREQADGKRNEPTSYAPPDSASTPNQQDGAPNSAADSLTGAEEVARPDHVAEEVCPARSGGFGEVLDASDESGNPLSQAGKSRQEHEWNIAADQAMRSANACGRMPSQIERPLNESRESRQDWRAVLRDFVTSRVLSDFSWSPPNRRYIAAGLYLPSVERSGVGEIVVAVDTSGSISQKDLEQFAGEISAIAAEAEPEAIHVVYCDAAVQSSQEFQDGESIRLEPKGGGGTDFRPVFAWVEENQLDPVCLIYLTDLCCHSFPEAPEYPVLWVTKSRRKAPFGETLRIECE